MGKQMNVELTESIYPPEHVAESLRGTDLRDIRLRRQNFEGLRALQKIMLIEEDQVHSIDEVLARVLTFYNGFVPFKNLQPSSPTGKNWSSKAITDRFTEW
jgi:hypothetical protein